FQNMAYCYLSSPNGDYHFLIDVAAYFFHNSWSKAFKVESIQDAVSKGINWLTTAQRSNWIANIQSH
ncbi:hypothetical protein HY041_04045, partial [Candidatus Roizmanbacteria bacterium]|nr:hypothetical protein [Candidatus Roizmanbacteria bacterium]